MGIDESIREHLTIRNHAYYENNKKGTRQKRKEYYAKNKERILARQREWYKNNQDKVLDYRKRTKNRRKKYYDSWAKENKRNSDERVEAMIERALNRPNRIKIYNDVKMAIERGDIIRPSTCSICDSKRKTVAHNYDYEHYSHIQWVCRSCHKKIHLGTI